jgi:hypothetical protein
MYKTTYLFELLNVPPLFPETSRTIRAFLAMLHEPEYPAAVEVRFSILQPGTHGLLDCLVLFIMLAPHVI